MALDFPNAPHTGDVFDRWRWDSEKWIPIASTATPYLPLAGGVMLGPITLAGNATANLNPVPLQQLNTRLAAYLPLTGGSLSGPLSVAGNMVATGLVQGGTVNSTGDLTAGGNIGTNNVLYAGAVQSGAFYGNPTFTGSITVNGNISTPNGVYAAVVSAGTYAGNVTITGSATVNGNISTGNTVFAGAVQTPQLNGNVYVTGNLNSGGQVQGNSLYARDRIDAGGGIFAGNLVQSNRGDDLAFYAPYGGVTIATAFVSNRSGSLGVYCPYSDGAFGGTLSAGNLYTGGTVTGGYITSTGNVNANADVTGNRVFANYIESRGDLRGTSQVVSNNNIYVANDGSFSLSQAGGERFLSFMGGWALVCNTGNGWLSWNNPGGLNWIMGADGFCYGNMNSVGGRGEYVNFSDERFKDAITPTTRGLPEILQLNPVEYEFIPPPQIEPPAAQTSPPEGTEPIEPPPSPPPTQKRHLGFVAQEVAPIIPEAVNIIGVQAPDGTGGMDTADPTLGVTVGSIVACIVNAIKTIDQRLTALEGA